MFPACPASKPYQCSTNPYLWNSRNHPVKWDMLCETKAVIVVASNIDLPVTDWAVTKNQGEAFAASIGGTFIETSAKEDIGVEEMTATATSGALIHLAK